MNMFAIECSRPREAKHESGSQIPTAFPTIDLAEAAWMTATQTQTLQSTARKKAASAGREAFAAARAAAGAAEGGGGGRAEAAASPTLTPAPLLPRAKSAATPATPAKLPSQHTAALGRTSCSLALFSSRAEANRKALPVKSSAPVTAIAKSPTWNPTAPKMRRCVAGCTAPVRDPPSAKAKEAPYPMKAPAKTERGKTLESGDFDLASPVETARSQRAGPTTHSTTGVGTAAAAATTVCRGCVCVRRGGGEGERKARLIFFVFVLFHVANVSVGRSFCFSLQFRVVPLSRKRESDSRYVAPLLIAFSSKDRKSVKRGGKRKRDGDAKSTFPRRRRAIGATAPGAVVTMTTPELKQLAARIALFLVAPPRRAGLHRVTHGVPAALDERASSVEEFIVVREKGGKEARRSN